MAKIKILADSASDISQQMAKELNMTVVPLNCTFDGENYFEDGVDMTASEFFEKLRATDVIPKTTQITPLRFEEEYNKILDEGYDTIIAVMMSSKASGTCQNAILAAQNVMDERECDIVVYDSMLLSGAYGILAYDAAILAKNGATKEEIINRIDTLKDKMQINFVVGTLDYLKKNGRINAATMTALNLFEMRPVMDLQGGLVVQAGFVRGTKRIVDKLIKYEEERGLDVSKQKRMIVVHSSMPDVCKEAAQKLREKNPDLEIVEWEQGALIGCHAGPWLLGIGYNLEW